MIKLGHDVILIPTYTPILTDETNISSGQLFYGGLNVYLQQQSALFRWLPKWADQFLSSPKLVGWVASRAMGTSASNLGGLTVSMLKGKNGRQKKEVERLCEWLQTQTPDVVVFSNLLIAGCISEIKEKIRCPVVVILQGDDIFYDSLELPFREQAMVELKRLAQEVDLFVVHSEDYGRRMGAMLEFDASKLAVSPLSIDTSDFAESHFGATAPVDSNRPPTVGYLARLAPEKGLHILVDAFIQLSNQMPGVRLEIAGWLGGQHATYWQQQQEKLQKAGLADQWKYHGSVDRGGKLDFLRSIDVLSVPTPYQEPKGLFVLEGLAAGVPYVQPSHGSFPEIHQRLGGGHLVAPESPTELAERLAEVLADRVALRHLGQQGRDRLLGGATTAHEANRFEEILSRLL